MYHIKEIFGPTIQGEGKFTGTIVKFIRFSGCNRWSGLEENRHLSICHFCDTDFRGGEPMTIETILEALDPLGRADHVVLSGGEPTLQLDLPILSALHKKGYKLHLETNGSIQLGERLPLIDHITLSPKQGRHETLIERCDEIKLLYPPIHPDVTPEMFDGFPTHEKFLQPVWDAHYRENLRATLQKCYETPDWRLSLQTHKMIGVA